MIRPLEHLSLELVRVDLVGGNSVGIAATHTDYEHAIAAGMLPFCHGLRILISLGHLLRAVNPVAVQGLPPLLAVTLPGRPAACVAHPEILLTDELTDLFRRAMERPPLVTARIQRRLQLHKILHLRGLHLHQVDLLAPLLHRPLGHTVLPPQFGAIVSVCRLQGVRVGNFGSVGKDTTVVAAVAAVPSDGTSAIPCPVVSKFVGLQDGLLEHS
mmetsp:Transcript_59319/g.158834  ORF Transcript_59319/g.158834 Transcript_59319/m.158834 type:complete len:214 (+) Transcript_59319:239-880(+)